MMQLTAADGHSFAAYRSDPAESPKGAVVILQESSGVNPRIRAVADHFAANGYVAIAPALFDRVRKGVELGYDEGSLSEASEIVKQTSDDGAIADIQAAVDAVRDAGKVAVVGYGWGGYLSFLSANHINGLACAVGYYGNGITAQPREKRRTPTLLHFGVKDALIPFEETVIPFRFARPDVTVYGYPAGHGFDCAECAGFDESSANLAGERTLFMVSQYVVGQAPVQLTNAGAYAAASNDKKKKKKPVADMDGPPE